MREQTLDLRVHMLAIVLGCAAAFLLRTEIGLIAVVGAAAVWNLFQRQWRACVSFLVLYGLLFWISSGANSSQVMSSLAVVSVVFRRMLVPLMLAAPLANAPIGRVVATLSKMRIPNSVTIGIAVMFRFVPTLRFEYRAIRTSQRFRGIGVGVLSAVTHPIVLLETLMVPLIIRTTRIADELAAAAMLKGADRRSRESSYYAIAFRPVDGIACAAVLVTAAACYAVDRLVPFLG